LLAFSFSLSSDGVWLVTIAFSQVLEVPFLRLAPIGRRRRTKKQAYIVERAPSAICSTGRLLTLTRTVMTPLQRSERNFRWILVALTLAAEAVGAYLSYEYLTFDFNSCSIKSGPFDWLSCGTVANSGYTSLFGVPFWAMGLAWFPIVLLVGLFLERQVLFLVLMIGNMFTIYLWYLELAVIHAVCPVCLSLYIFNYALTGVTAKYLFT
jgi:uncharacterized membrane protein